ncbi:uncharacterized [Tachysurus ichikawai]
MLSSTWSTVTEAPCTESPSPVIDSVSIPFTVPRMVHRCKLSIQPQPFHEASPHHGGDLRFPIDHFGIPQELSSGKSIWPAREKEA